MQAIIGLIILVCWVVAIIDAIKSNMENGKKILWILIILFLPVIGMILYFLIGKKKT